MKKTASGKIILENLSSNVYEHPAEKEIQKAVSNNKAIEKAFDFIAKYGIERLVISEYIANSIEVKPTNFPEIDKIKEEVCEILDVKTLPRMYIQVEGKINCEAIGISEPIVILNTGTIDRLKNDELFFIIGHEIAQIKSQHTRYLFINKILPMLSDAMQSASSAIPIVGDAIGSMLSSGLSILLYQYERITDYSADRASLLTCQDMDIALKTLMKISGCPAAYYDKMNKDDFIKQFDDFESSNTSNKILDLLANYDKKRANSVRRAKELYDWYNTKEHEKILALDYGKVETNVPEPAQSENKVEKSIEGFVGKFKDSLKGF